MLLLCSVLFLFACESRLELDNVEKALKEPIRRTDLFQAIEVRESSVVVVARSGIILVSSDKGQSWTRNQMQDWPSFIDVTSCDDGLFAALAAEGEVWISENQGQLWHKTKLDTEEIPQAITCDPQNKLWVVGSFSTITTSEDQGQTWLSTSRDEDMIMTGIQFLNESHAVISAEFGTLLSSSDGGASWEMQSPMPNEYYPETLYFSDPEHGWVIGLIGSVLYTDDGGQTWQSQDTETNASLFGIERIGEQMYIVGGEGTILCLQGERWVKLDHGKPVRLHLRGIAALDDTHFMVAGRAGALHVINVITLLSSLNDENTLDKNDG